MSVTSLRSIIFLYSWTLMTAHLVAWGLILHRKLIICKGRVTPHTNTSSDIGLVGWLSSSIGSSKREVLMCSLVRLLHLSSTTQFLLLMSHIVLKYRLLARPFSWSRLRTSNLEIRGFHSFLLFKNWPFFCRDLITVPWVSWDIRRHPIVPIWIHFLYWFQISSCYVLLLKPLFFPWRYNNLRFRVPLFHLQLLFLLPL